MLASREHVVPSARARGAFLSLALLVALALVLGTGPGGSFAATTTTTTTTTAKPAAKATAKRAPAKPAHKVTGSDSLKVATAKALPDSLPRLEAAVRKDSTNVKALYRLGIAYLDRDRPIDAAIKFQKAVALKPDYVEAWVNLGAAEDANGHGAQARLDYRQALTLHADDQIAMCRMASSFYAAGIKDSAMGVIRDILKKDEKSSCAYFTLGVSFADASMFKEAIRAWQKVVDITPKSPEAESATESIKLLKEYLGPAEMLNAAAAGAPGVVPGSGGPDNVIPGGSMTGAAAQPAKATPATPAAPAAGAKPETKSDKNAKAMGGK
jgi:Flp pilus assembly protein TadD